MLLGTIALLLALQAAPAPATPKPDDIVVTGQRLTPETARRYVNDISRPVNGQLPLFRYPVCPAVQGVAPEHAAVVVERIRKVVKHVGIRLDKPDCAPNLRVIVVDDSQKFVEELSRKNPGYFEGLERSELKRLLRDESPALAWSNLQAQNEDGHIYADNVSGRSPFDRMSKNRMTSGDASMNMPRGDGAAGVMRTSSASIIKATTRQAMVESYVVVEASAIDGKSLMQLADYATMRTLAAAQPPANGAIVDTILTLFNPAQEAPPSIRVPDIAYLKALYSAAPTMTSAQQLNRLTKAVLEASSGE
jgi:hypothetical protein